MWIALLSLAAAVEYTDKDVKKEMSSFISDTIKSELKSSLRSMDVKRKLHGMVLDTVDPVEIDGQASPSIERMRMEVRVLQDQLNRLQKMKQVREKRYKKMMARRETLRKMDELARAQAQQAAMVYPMYQYYQ